MNAPFAKLSSRRTHLAQGNLLRSLTDVINAVPNGINLGQGVCDLDAPTSLRRGAIDSIDGGDRQIYTPYVGLPELRDQIAAKLGRHNGIDVDRDRVLVALGSSGAFFAAGLCLLEPGDEVVLFEPFYSYHHSALRLLGAVPRCVRLAGPDHSLDVDAFRSALTKRTRAVVVNSPANPSGKMFTREELRAIGEVLDGTDVVVLTDEVYEYMCFDGREHVSPATVPELADRSLTLGGFSKTFSITGWRIGYLVGPPDVVDAIGLICDQMHVCAPRPMQRGVERALAELPEAFYRDLRDDYERRRDRFCVALERAGFRFARPQGAYYVMADYRAVFGDVEPHPAVLAMIERIGVNGVPGHVFYAEPAGIRSIRFHFAVADAVLEDACQRFESLA